MKVKHFSMSSLKLLMEDELMFYKQYVLGLWDKEKQPFLAEGSAFHKMVELYWNYKLINGTFPKDSTTLMSIAKSGLKEFDDNDITYNTKDPEEIKKAKKKFIDVTLKTFDFYRAETPACIPVSTEEMILVDVEDFDGSKLPVQLKCVVDLICEDEKEGLYAKDHKTCSSFSNPETDNLGYVFQACAIYYAVKGKYGIAPTRIEFDEIKKSENRDASPQVRTITIVPTETDLKVFIEIFKRAIKKVEIIDGDLLLPNINSMFNAYKSWGYFKTLI